MSPFVAALYEDLTAAHWNYLSVRDRPSIDLRNRMGIVVSSDDNDVDLKEAIKNFRTCLIRYQLALIEEGHKFV